MLRIKNGEAEIMCPIFTPNFYLKKIIKERNKWIQEKIQNTQKCNLSPISIENNFIRFRFKKVRLEFIEKENKRISLKNGILKIESNFKKNKNKKEIIVDWLKNQAKDYLSKRISFLSKEVSIPYKKLKVKSFKSRWGSCDRKGEILLNWKLIMLPTKVIDYVIIHELSHIKVPNHSKDFWDLVYEIYPGYQKRKEWLRKYGEQFIQI